MIINEVVVGVAYDSSSLNESKALLDPVTIELEPGDRLAISGLDQESRKRFTRAIAGCGKIHSGGVNNVQTLRYVSELWPAADASLSIHHNIKYTAALYRERVDDVSKILELAKLDISPKQPFSVLKHDTKVRLGCELLSSFGAVQVLILGSLACFRGKNVGVDIDSLLSTGDICVLDAGNNRRLLDQCNRSYELKISADDSNLN